MGSQERQELQRTHEQRVAELQTQHTTHVAQLTAQWTAERESLQARLKDEEERCSTLRQELMNAVRGAAFHTSSPQSVTHTTQLEMKSPELKQFLVRYRLFLVFYFELFSFILSVRLIIANGGADRHFGGTAVSTRKRVDGGSRRG